MDLLLRACFGVFMLMLCAVEVYPISSCYQCNYAEVNGQPQLEDDMHDNNCKDSPELGFSGPCKGDCVIMEFKQTTSIFGQTDMTYQLSRGCTEYLADPNFTPTPAEDMPKPGTCYKDDAFEDWFMKTFVSPEPSQSPHLPFGSQPPPFGPIGSPPPGIDPAFPDGGFDDLAGGFEDLLNSIKIEVEGSVCTCSSNYCKIGNDGGTGSSNIVIPGRILVTSGVIIASILMMLTS